MNPMPESNVVAGITCEICDSDQIGVTDSRPSKVGRLGTVKRRRKCEDCGNIWTTHEVHLDLIKNAEKVAAKKIITEILKRI